MAFLHNALLITSFSMNKNVTLNLSLVQITQVRQKYVDRCNVFYFCFVAMLTDLKLVLTKGDGIRLTNDVTSSHFYEIEYFKSLAVGKGLDLAGVWGPSKVYGHCAVVFNKLINL